MEMEVHALGVVQNGRSISTARAVGFALAVLILLFGWLARPDSRYSELRTLHWVLFASPLLAQLLPWKAARIYSLWLGAFLLAQALLSPGVDGAFKTLRPSYHRVIDVTSGLPGIQGIQTITTDHKGFRTTKTIDYGHKPETTYRIFAIGGSTTEQIYLDDRATWTHLLQESLDRSHDREIEVVNTGVSGLRAEHHLATLEHVLAYAPDMAIFLVGINDWNRQIRLTLGDASRQRRRQLLRRFRERYRFNRTLLGGVLAAALYDPEPRVGPAVEETGSYYEPLRGGLWREPRRSFRPASVSESYEARLGEIAARCRRAEIACVFLTQPTGYAEDADEEYLRSFWMTPPEEDYTLDLASMIHITRLYNEFLLAFARSEGLPSCDMASAFPASFETLYDECHFNTRGAQRFAELLVACVDPLID
jgi:lysophospholipase L1-like esterase